MKIEDLKRGIELHKKMEFVAKRLVSLESDSCIIVGTGRMDDYMDIHKRIRLAMKTTLEEELANINKEIEKL